MKTLLVLILTLSFTSCLKIYQDTRYIDTTTPATTSTWKDYIKSIIEACTSYMNKAVLRRVNLNSEINPLTRVWKPNCIGPEEYDWPSGGISSEFDFFVSFRPKLFLNATIAETFICQRTASNAPTIANIFLSPEKIIAPDSSWPVSRITMEREKHIYTVLHELTHAFGVTTQFHYWNDRTNGYLPYQDAEVQWTLDGTSYSTLQIPSIRDYLQELVGCQNNNLVKGLPLFGSHPHARFFPYEAFVSGANRELRITKLTFKLLEATGYWNLNWNYDEPDAWARNAGCSFFTASAPNSYEGFCAPTSPAVANKCTFHGRSWSSCKSVSNTGEFLVYPPSTNTNFCWDGHTASNTVESFQVNSKCFEGSLSGLGSSPYCLQYSCIFIGGQLTLRLKTSTGSTLVDCTAEGSTTVSGYGTISCPDPDFYCNGPGKKYCPRNCMGRGTCTSYTCSCESGWSGYDCSQKDTYTFWGV